MGLLVDGIWKDQWYDTKKTGGRFVRSESQFRHQIEPAHPPSSVSSGIGAIPFVCGERVPMGPSHPYHAQFEGLGRPHFSVCGCPNMLENGWEFDSQHQDDLFAAEYLYQVYLKADPQYSGRVTVPLLWDKKTNQAVSNESSEIIRMFNSAFNDITGDTADYYPESLRQSIDLINDKVYHQVNNGVYKSGFATTPSAYQEAVTALFDTLDWLDELLGTQPFLVGEYFTEADLRLFTTLIRFDAVYVGHFKCNLKRIVDYPNLSHYVRQIYQFKMIASTLHMEEVKQHYYVSHTGINPTQIIPLGPLLDFDDEHNRGEVKVCTKES